MCHTCAIDEAPQLGPPELSGAAAHPGARRQRSCWPAGGHDRELAPVVFCYEELGYNLHGIVISPSAESCNTPQKMNQSLHTVSAKCYQPPPPPYNPPPPWLMI